MLTLNARGNVKHIVVQFLESFCQEFTFADYDGFPLLNIFRRFVYDEVSSPLGFLLGVFDADGENFEDSVRPNAGKPYLSLGYRALTCHWLEKTVPTLTYDELFLQLH